ncbi:MAG: DUF484 family protein [Pseudomonadota bacterium]
MSDLTLSDADRDLIRSLIVAEPALVLDDDDVMRRLVGEEQGDRKVVDLRDRLVERLERRLEKLALTHRTVIAAAYENVSGTAQLHRAVLALIEPPDLAAFLQRLIGDVPLTMGVEEARLCLETDVTETGPATGFGLENDARVLALPEGTVSDYMSLDGRMSEPVVLREAGAEAELIFGEANPVQSEACMRLELGGATAMLVFGSSDPRKFDAAHGVDLLVFFGGVVERLLVQHLAGAGGA